MQIPDCRISSTSSASVATLRKRSPGSGRVPTARSPSGSLEQALGADTVDALAKQTGLSREEILSRLSAVLPNAVDKMTPNGRLPDHKWSS